MALGWRYSGGDRKVNSKNQKNQKNLLSLQNYEIVVMIGNEKYERLMMDRQEAELRLFGDSL